MKRSSIILCFVFCVTACGNSDKPSVVAPVDNSVTFTVALKSLDIRDGNGKPIDLDVSGINNTLRLQD